MFLYNTISRRSGADPQVCFSSSKLSQLRQKNFADAWWGLRQLGMWETLAAIDNYRLGMFHRTHESADLRMVYFFLFFIVFIVFTTLYSFRITDLQMFRSPRKVKTEITCQRQQKNRQLSSQWGTKCYQVTFLPWPSRNLACKGRCVKRGMVQAFLGGLTNRKIHKGSPIQQNY